MNRNVLVYINFYGNPHLVNFKALFGRWNFTIDRVTFLGQALDLRHEVTTTDRGLIAGAAKAKYLKLRKVK